MKKTAFLAGAFALLSVSPVAWAQSAAFCSEAGFGGTCTSPIPPGYYTLSQLASYGFQNDWASSCGVPNGGTVQLFADDNFGGQHWEIAQNYGGQNLSLIGADNVVSSAKIRMGVTFFQDVNYQGNATSINGLQVNTCYSLASLQQYGFVNDWASSVMMPSNWVVDLYSDDNLGGTKWTLSQLDSNSADFRNFGGNDVVSSVCVRYVP
jgi:hypothetical protein